MRDRQPDPLAFAIDALEEARKKKRVVVEEVEALTATLEGKRQERSEIEVEIEKLYQEVMKVAEKSLKGMY